MFTGDNVSAQVIRQWSKTQMEQLMTASVKISINQWHHFTLE